MSSRDWYYRRAYEEYIRAAGVDDFARAEELLDDTPPGLQPILAGDVYDKRYMVTKPFPQTLPRRSIWIGVDLHTYTTRTRPTCEHLILKFARAELHTSREFRAEIELQAVVADQLQQAWIPQTYSPVHRIFRSFKFYGRDGQHICLVGERMLCCLDSMLVSARMPIVTVRLMARDLLRALLLLHGDCQLVHTNLNPSNVFVARSQDQLAQGEYREVYDHEPCTQAGFDFPLPVVKLGGLGAATAVRAPAVLVPIGRLHYRAPEVLAGIHYGPSFDIWSLACTLFEAATGAKLFHPEAFLELGLNESHALLSAITQVVGPIPSCLDQQPVMKLYYEAISRINPRHLLAADEFRISHRLQRLSGFSEEEATEMEAFLLPMLEMDPGRRPAALEVLSHPWLEPALEIDF